jgi:broad specificity phosphatase PhoE
MTGSLLDTAAASSLMDAPPKIAGTIYLMRHGHTVLDVDKRSDGFLDFPLSDKGRLGIVEAQQYLKTVPIVCIYCADLKRTKETAEIIKSGTLSSPRIDKADEGRTWDLGVLAGTAKKQSRSKVQQLMLDPTSRPMGGESFNEFKARFLPWFSEMTDEVLDTGKPVLYVGSGSNLRLISQTLLGDIDILDLDEGGLAALHSVQGEWHADVILGADDDGDQVS